MRHTVGVLAVVLTACAVATAAEAKDWSFAAKPGENAIGVTVMPVENRAVSLDVYTADSPKPTRVSLSYPGGSWHKGGLLHDWHQDISWSQYCANTRAKKPNPPETVYSNAYVQVSGKGWFDFGYSMLPYFQPFVGLYRHDRVAKDIAGWLKDYPLYPERTFAFDFRHDVVRHRLEGYLDGNYAGHLDVTGRLEKVVVRASSKAKVTGQSRTHAFALARPLPSVLHRSHPQLQKGARLVLDPKLKERINAALTIWNPSESIDQGQHRSTQAGHRE